MVVSWSQIILKLVQKNAISLRATALPLYSRLELTSLIFDSRLGFQNFYLVMMSAMCLSLAGCNSKSGGSDGSNALSGDTTSVKGSIESVSLRDSMIVVTTDKGWDTVFYNSKTNFTLGNPGKVLCPQSEIDIQYVKMDKKKVAVKIQPAATGEENKKK